MERLPARPLGALFPGCASIISCKNLSPDTAPSRKTRRRLEKKSPRREKQVFVGAELGTGAETADSDFEKCLVLENLLIRPCFVEQASKLSRYWFFTGTEPPHAK
jgi:hypothetical protein